VVKTREEKVKWPAPCKGGQEGLFCHLEKERKRYVSAEDIRASVISRGEIIARQGGKKGELAFIHSIGLTEGATTTTYY